jgi:hypothetical protein
MAYIAQNYGNQRLITEKGMFVPSTNVDGISKAQPLRHKGIRNGKR